MPPLWATAAAALLGAGAHFTQTLPDIARERIAGVRGLPQLLGQKASSPTMNRLELAFRLTLVSGGIVVVTLLAAGVSL